VIDDFFILCVPPGGGTSLGLTVTQTVTSAVTVLQSATVTVATPVTVTYTKTVTQATVPQSQQIQLPQLDWGFLIPIALSIVAIIIAVIALARTHGARSIASGVGSQAQLGRGQCSNSSQENRG